MEAAEGKQRRREAVMLLDRKEDTGNGEKMETNDGGSRSGLMGDSERYGCQTDLAAGYFAGADAGCDVNQSSRQTHTRNLVFVCFEKKERKENKVELCYFSKLINGSFSSIRVAPQRLLWVTNSSGSRFIWEDLDAAART